MKKLAILSFASLLFIACGGGEDTPPAQTETVDGKTMSYYGEKITPDNAISLATLQEEMNASTSMTTKVEGTIIETCAKKGCWMSMDMGEGDNMIVTFKDYGFFVPVEGVGGKKAIVEGVCVHDTLDVDWLKHVAEDAGRSQEEIDAITEPEIALAFEATGVIIED